MLRMEVKGVCVGGGEGIGGKGAFVKDGRGAYVSGGRVGYGKDKSESRVKGGREK